MEESSEESQVLESKVESQEAAKVEAVKFVVPEAENAMAILQKLLLGDEGEQFVINKYCKLFVVTGNRLTSRKIISA